MKLSYNNNWFCCSIDGSDKVELCKIKLNRGIGTHSVITYYSGQEVYSGSIQQCKTWIENHWIEKRYLDHYGKAD